MTGKLVYYKHDPNGKGRGPGFYYHRGHGIYSKFSLGRDHMIKADSKIHKGNWRYMHTGDGTYIKTKWKNKNEALLWRKANRDKRV